MRILFVNQPRYDPFDLRKMEPLGLTYIAAVLERHGFGRDVEILDPNLHEKTSSVGAIVDEIISRKPEIVGFSTFSKGFQDILKISRHIKRIEPKLIIVFGGHLATALHEIILRRFPRVDVVVRGEGEYTMLDLVKTLNSNEELDEVLGISYRNGKEVIVNPPRPLASNLDEMPFPARHKLPSFDNSIACVLSSRGCPFNCRFCDVSSFYRGSPGPFWRARSPSNIVDEIEHLVTRGVELVHFVDDCFLVDPHRIEELCIQIQKRNLRLSFAIVTRADQIVRNSALLPLLRQSGCIYVEMGVENGCQKVLDRYGKQLKVSENVEALKLLRQNKIGYDVGFILFDKHTTFEELSMNLNFIERNSLTLQGDIFFTRMIPYPGTRIHQEYFVKGSLRGKSYNPTYQIDDERTDQIFKAVSDFRRRLEAKRIRKIDETEDNLERIDNLINRIAPAPNGALRNMQLKDLYHKYRFYNVALKRFPYLFFKMIMREMKKNNGSEIKIRSSHLLHVIQKNLENQYQAVDRLNVQLEKTVCKLEGRA